MWLRFVQIEPASLFDDESLFFLMCDLIVDFVMKNEPKWQQTSLKGTLDANRFLLTDHLWFRWSKCMVGINLSQLIWLGNSVENSCYLKTAAIICKNFSTTMCYNKIIRMLFLSLSTLIYGCELKLRHFEVIFYHSILNTSILIFLQSIIWLFGLFLLSLFHFIHNWTTSCFRRWGKYQIILVSLSFWSNRSAHICRFKWSNRENERDEWMNEKNE